MVAAVLALGALGAVGAFSPVQIGGELFEVPQVETNINEVDTNQNQESNYQELNTVQNVDTKWSWARLNGKFN